jgi:hypothetical protein
MKLTVLCGKANRTVSNRAAAAKAEKIHSI